MSEDGRVVTAKLPDDLVEQMDVIAQRIERTKSWIIREAVSQWLTEEQRRFDLTMEALRSVDEGRTHSHEEAKEHFAARRKSRAKAARAA